MGSQHGPSQLVCFLPFPDGSKGQYFIKSAPADHGRSMMEGEFNAMSELYKWAPDFVPKPIGWDKYKLEEPEAYFFVAEYVDMQGGMPDPDKLCSRLARLHRGKISDPVYTKTYKLYQEPSEPKDECEDRNRLYSVYYNLLYSVNHAKAGTAVRQQAFAGMYHLVDKYAPFPGNEGPPTIAADQMAVLPVEENHTMSTVPNILRTL